MKERIAVNPQIHFGKPCIAGTRIPVQNVLELLREGLSSSTIIAEYYPDLAPEDIRTCIQFATENENDFDLEASPDFWRMIEDRRRRPTVALKDVEATLFADDPSE